MSHNSLQDIFLDQVNRLDLRFPVAEIAEKTRIGQPTVSMYLSGKRPVALKFFRTFCKAYDLDYEELIKKGREINKRPGVSGGDAPAENSKEITRAMLDQAKALKDQAEANKLQAEANKKNAEAFNRLASAIENMSVSFGTILSSQDAGFGLVAELVNRQVHNDANGNEEKVKLDLDEIARRIGPGLGSIAKKGIGADGHSDDTENP